MDSSWALAAGRRVVEPKQELRVEHVHVAQNVRLAGKPSYHEELAADKGGCVLVPRHRCIASRRRPAPNPLVCVVRVEVIGRTHVLEGGATEDNHGRRRDLRRSMAHACGWYLTGNRRSPPCHVHCVQLKHVVEAARV